MTHSQVYCTDKLRKNLFFDETRCVGARVENLLSGRSVYIGADKVVIVWSESGRGKKRTFDTTSGELLSVDSDGYAVRSADGLFEVRGLQFPAAHLYNHEPCYALRNRNLAKKTNAPVTFTDEQFRTYLRCCMMRGSGLAELYFSPAMMDGEKWKIAAQELSFAERNFDTLSASRFFGGDPEKGEPYGYYAERDGSYALMLRNPSPSPAAVSFTFPAAGTVSATLSPFEIRFSTDLT